VKQPLLLPLLFSALLSLFASVSSAGITLSEPKLYESDSRIWVNVEFNYELGNEVIDAMKNGIPLVFHAEYRIEEMKPLWEENPITHTIEHRFILSYREFTNRYYLISLQNNTHGTYDNLSDALARMERRHTALNIDRNTLERNSNYQARVRASLDGSALPGLIRPYLYTPYLWPQWKLDSGWHTLPIPKVKTP